MREFTPDYTNIVKSARNIEAPRLPLYEHIICPEVMEYVLGRKFAELIGGDDRDLREYYRNYCEFFRVMGYDTVSYEICIGSAMPGAGCLGNPQKDPVICEREDFEKYPWDEVPEIFFNNFSRHFEALRDVMPDGMKGIGGVGNGIFECAQEITGYMNLCYIAADDPGLYGDLFAKVGETNYKIWERFMQEYGDIFCVLRFGDDLGFKSNTLLSADDIRTYIIPRYKAIIDLVHSYGKPFLLHSCGCIFDVMEDLIAAGIDAKHSNEDQIAPFPVWVEKYGERIGNFGGIDTDAVCRLTKSELREYITDVVKQCTGHGGFAFASGNSIPNYVPADNYISMVEIVRELRGDFK